LGAREKSSFTGSQIIDVLKHQEMGHANVMTFGPGTIRLYLQERERAMSPVRFEK
jgi:hypothetical protein